MISRFLASLFALALFAAWSANADLTWPSSVDELEDIMYLNTGFRKSGFADAVTPCGFSAAGPGRITAAEWIRTAFHDMATGNVFLGGSGGLDASIMFETTRSENIGAAFNSSLGFFANYYSTRVTISDLIALSVYTSVRSCGGPSVAIRAGRVDATVAGASGVPIPQNPVGVFENQFARMGFNRTEMIQMTACGHTVGGVHAEDFPQIVVPGTAPNNYMAVDSSIAVFDNRVAVEWIAGNTTDPMAVGPSVKITQNSDTTVFGADSNITMKALTDPAIFASTCKSILQRMIELVPPNVILTDPVVPFEVKPSELQLTLLPGGASISFTGLIRVRTTIRPMSDISSVQLIYLDRNGANSCGSCVIGTTFAGTSNGFDDSFTFYSFSATLPSDLSISSFNVLITLKDHGTELHDNNGAGYPVQDSIMLQSPQSCLSQVPDGNGNLNLTVIAAVRNDLASSPVNLNLTTLVPRQGVIVPALTSSFLSMVQGSCVGPYTLYSVSYAIPSGQAASAKFDVLSGTGSNILADTFKSPSDLTNSCASLDSGGATCSLAPTSTYSSSPSTSNSISTSTSSSSSSSSSDNISSSDSASSTTSTSMTSTSTSTSTSASSISSNTSTYLSSTSTSTSTPVSSTLTSTATSSSSTSSSTSPSSSSSSTSSSTSETTTSTSTSSSSTSSSSTSSSSTSSSSTSSSTRPSSSSTSSSISTRTSSTSSNTSSSSSRTSTTTSTSSTGTSTSTSFSSTRTSTSSSSSRTSTTSSTSSTRTGSSTSSTSTSSSTSRPTTSTTSTSSKPTTTTSSKSSTTSSISTTRSSTSTTSSTTTAKPSPTGPVIKSDITNYTYYGCQTEATNMRALSADHTISDTMTLEACSAYCNGYLYWGAEYARECYCGNSFNAGSIGAPDTDCSMVCTGDSLEFCGAGNRLSVYALNTTLSPPTPTPAIKPTVGAYSYYGCQTEATNMRALSSATNATDSMTLELCESFCAGHTYWGVEYGRECYCGNSLNPGSVAAPASDCSFLCPGNKLEFCGAGMRLSTYVLN